MCCPIQTALYGTHAISIGLAFPDLQLLHTKECIDLEMLAKFIMMTSPQDNDKNSLVPGLELRAGSGNGLGIGNCHELITK